jgi:hypothetical protein
MKTKDTQRPTPILLVNLVTVAASVLVPSAAPLGK